MTWWQKTKLWVGEHWVLLLLPLVALFFIGAWLRDLLSSRIIDVTAAADKRADEEATKRTAAEDAISKSLRLAEETHEAKFEEKKIELAKVETIELKALEADPDALVEAMKRLGRGDKL